MAGNVSRVRPLRADAVRNRDRVLRVAYETFASEGLTVPVDEIARRAGVGAGTIYRHFPTKEALYAAVVEHRLQEMSDRGRQLLSSGDPGEALFAFLRAMVLEWGASDHVLIDALAGRGIDVHTVAPEADRAARAVLGELLAAGQRAGTVRTDLGVPELKAIMAGCQAIGVYEPDVAARATAVVTDGLRPPRAEG
ncbi:putative transcriptional regulatory protein TetR [Mycolicibacterium litorale]|uniref:Putative transcriptional regulatory protein TetR n=1 Tax=Mycolicibacterium litorale TaxID=758802 RepID=A0A6S6P4X1_9MYCO|nr:TetR/AcrR family transcriptional regulator [Mycolicibacterium litorale]BCI51378.1 putative transcriptional regulatory protein TetR [Mycolicibacterium litorale]